MIRPIKNTITPIINKANQTGKGKYPIIITETIFDSFQNFHALNFKEPVKLKDLIADIIQNRNDAKYKELFGVVDDKIFMKNFQKSLANSQFETTKILKIAGMGTSAIAFEREDGKILKIAQNHRFNLHRPQESFDVPIYEKGKFGSMRYFVEEKCYNNDLPIEFTEIIREQILKAGYKCRDMEYGSTHQIGMNAQGKLFLVDAECARYKTIFHAIFDKIKRKILLGNEHKKI